MKKKKIINNVEITQDDNVTHFKPIEQKKPRKRKQKKQIEKPKDKSWYEKLYSWWDDLKIKPYLKFRDLANPFGDRTDSDAGSDGKTCAEVGIKIKF